MKVGIISDTHDDADALKAALGVLRSEGVSKILHCGDLCGPDIIRMLAGFDVRIAEGNMDRQLGLEQAAEEMLGPGRLTWLHEFTLDGYPAVMLHGDNEEVLDGLIACGEYAYVFHGHTHQRRDQMVGRTRVINPGALGGTRHQTRSFCILDLATGAARFVEIG